MKKFLLWGMTIIVFVLVLVGYGYCNLKYNSVYYAKNTPHKDGTEPVLIMLVDNLNWIYTPTIDGIEYDFDAGKGINNRNFSDKDLSWFGTFDGNEYIYGDENYTLYGFDKDFNLLYVSEDGKGRIDTKGADMKKIKNDIYKILKPIIDRQTKPIINLQWLFDIVYKDKFN